MKSYAAWSASRFAQTGEPSRTEIVILRAARPAAARFSFLPDTTQQVPAVSSKTKGETGTGCAARMAATPRLPPQRLVKASTELAQERGHYSSFTGSLCDQGILPLDSIRLLEEGRGGYLKENRAASLDWDALKERIARHGMRNSNCVAIAPTATNSKIAGVSASIEPTYQNIYVKSNLFGEFTVVNDALVHDLKALDLGDEVMVADLKYFDSSLARIDRVPDELKARYATALDAALGQEAR